MVGLLLKLHLPSFGPSLESFLFPGGDRRESAFLSLHFFSGTQEESSLSHQIAVQHYLQHFLHHF